VKLAAPFVLLILAATAVAATASGRISLRPTASKCGGELWRLKTFSDPQRNSVDLRPAATTIEAISQRPYPRPVPRRRRTSFQHQDWEVVAQITQFKLDAGGIRLVLYDANSYMNAVIPIPSCLSSKTRARGAILSAWKALSLGCAQADGSWQSLGAIAYVSGVGFWSQRIGRHGAALNGAELHPVTGLRVVAGCSKRANG
jgi:hypothetical protein